MTSQVEYRQVLDEMCSETERIYREYPELTVWDSIEIANKVIKYRYRGVELVDSDVE